MPLGMPWVMHATYQHAHTYTHMHTHAHTYTHMQKHAHTYTHMHTTQCVFSVSVASVQRRSEHLVSFLCVCCFCSDRSEHQVSFTEHQVSFLCLLPLFRGGLNTRSHLLNQHACTHTHTCKTQCFFLRVFSVSVASVQRRPEHPVSFAEPRPGADPHRVQQGGRFRR